MELTNKEKIEFGEACGLTHTGEYENGEPQFIGDNKAFAMYNDGEEIN